MAGQNIPLEGEIKLQLPVLIFTLGLSLVTGLLMGLYPAWQSSRADLVEGLKEGGRSEWQSRSTSISPRSCRWRKLRYRSCSLAGAAMLVSSFVRLSNQETGFRSDHVWAGAIGLPPARYPDSASRHILCERLQMRIEDRARR